MAALKLDAFKAEVAGDWNAAKQLWQHVLAAAPTDTDAAGAIRRLNQHLEADSNDNSDITTDNAPSGSMTRRRWLSFAGLAVVSTITALLAHDWWRNRKLPIPATGLTLKEYEFETVTVNRRGEIIRRTPGKAEYFTEDLGNGVTLQMVYIPGGTFIMGDDRPVERVSWFDAVEFCRRLSQKTGREYRLPSESEWEYACRAGTGTPFYFGETITTDLVNYDGDDTYADAPTGQDRQETTPVGQFPPNAFGLYDMHGNLWEWCADHWHGNYEGAPTDSSAWLSENKNNSRLLRGGSWLGLPRYCRSANRDRINPGDDDDNVGLRLVCGAASTLHRESRQVGICRECIEESSLVL